MSDDEDTGLSFGNWIPPDLLSSLGVDLGASGGGALSSLGLSSFNLGSGDAGGRIGEEVGYDFEDDIDAEIQRGETLPEESTIKRAANASRDGLRPKKKRKIVKDKRDGEEPMDVDTPAKPRDLKDVWPTFESDKVLNFTDLLQAKVNRKSRVIYKAPPTEPPPEPIQPPPKASLPPVLHLKPIARQIARGTAHEIEEENTGKDRRYRSVDTKLREAIKARAIAGVEVDSATLLDERSYDLVNLTNWEDEIAWESTSQPIRTQPVDMERPRNTILDSGDWTDSIIWDRYVPFRDFSQLNLEEEKPTRPLAITDGSKKDDAPTTKRKKRRGDNFQQQNPQAPATNKSQNALLALQARKSHLIPMDKFNISNDHFYEMNRERHGVRQTFGQLIVQHAYPAMKLQLPFYKTRLTKSEARSFHRPGLQFPTNVELSFAKVRGAKKKKKDKNGRKISSNDPSEALRTTSDLSLRETGPFVLWEYSEEHPPTLSNFGMGSVLVNYYRKRDENDDHLPHLDVGEPFILEPSDESPFMKFGSIAPGQTIPALYNNLVRAPLFRHKAAPTDFLVIKSTIGGVSRYYIREIKVLFTVGQTYPVTEVPGPHSRKITGTMKYRLQQIAYKLLRKTPDERLLLRQLLKYFPDQNELQMRQRLKEFMEFSRTGPHQGYWRLKPNHEMLPDSRMYELITPEHLVLYESMQVGQRHLLDAGYGTADTHGDEGQDDNSKLDIEQQLAPWITTKNFINAVHQKAMLKLHGPGDPTGRGEAFSFIRVSMKEIFVRAGENAEERQAEADQQRMKTGGHKYNVQEQQNIYRSEIERIWKAQYDSLINKVPPEMDDDDDHHPRGPLDRLRQNDRLDSPIDGRDSSPMMVDPSPAVSRAGSVTREEDEPPVSNKVLRIRRLVKGEWRTEIIRNPNVISAYVARREAIELNKLSHDQITMTGDPIKDAILAKKLEADLARMQKNQERRVQRKAQQILKEGGTLSPDITLKPDTTRRCGHCGQIGHMKTNRKCPRWHEFNPPNGGFGATPPTPGGAGSPPPPGTPSDDRRAGGSLGAMPPPPTLPFRSSFSLPNVPSPLATSPPLSGTPGAGSSAGAGPGTPTPTPTKKIMLKLGGPKPSGGSMSPK